jgi:hypothetical protein
MRVFCQLSCLSEKGLYYTMRALSYTLCDEHTIGLCEEITELGLTSRTSQTRQIPAELHRREHFFNLRAYRVCGRLAIAVFCHNGLRPEYRCNIVIPNALGVCEVFPSQSVLVCQLFG